MKNLQKVIPVLLAVYALLFAGRLIYVANVPEPEPVYQQNSYDKPMFSSTATVRNYAKVMFKTAAGQFQIGQTYEKIAEVYNSTNEFTEDEKKLRAILAAQEALIQKEQVSGRTGNRTVLMSIGVYPEKFDETVEKLKVTGINEQFQVTKTDKTGDYRKLRAERGALEERKKAMMQLKGKNGKVEEFVALENKIYEIVKEIHALDLAIGEFEGVKDFCTIAYSLTETGLKPPKPDKIGQALEWAFGKLIIISVIVFFGLISLMILVKIYELFRPKQPVLQAEQVLTPDAGEQKTEGKKRKK